MCKVARARVKYLFVQGSARGPSASSDMYASRTSEVHRSNRPLMSDDEETPRPLKRTRRGYKPSRNALTLDRDEPATQLPVELFTTEKTLNRRGERVERSQRFEPRESVSSPSRLLATTPSTPANVVCEPSNTFTPTTDYNAADESDDELPLDFGAFWGVRDSTAHVSQYSC